MRMWRQLNSFISFNNMFNIFPGSLITAKYVRDERYMDRFPELAHCRWNTMHCFSSKNKPKTINGETLFVQRECRMSFLHFSSIVCKRTESIYAWLTYHWCPTYDIFSLSFLFFYGGLLWYLLYILCLQVLHNLFSSSYMNKSEMNFFVKHYFNTVTSDLFLKSAAERRVRIRAFLMAVKSRFTIIIELLWSPSN